MLEKVRKRRSAREGPRGEGQSEKGHQRRSDEERSAGSAGEGPSEKVYKTRVVGKVALIPCEEKNNSLIFID